MGSALALDVEDLDLWVGDRRRGPVFSARDGDVLTARQAQRRFELWLGRAGIRGRYSPHSLRQTFALGLYQRTGDVLVVKEGLRHRAVTSTMVDARASAERVQAAVVGGALPEAAGSPLRFSRS
jgi:site-specific recombinase XerC